MGETMAELGTRRRAQEQSRSRPAYAARLAAALAAVGWSVLALPAAASDVPASTKEVLRNLSLDESILKGLDRELAVPPQWIENARKTGQLRLTGSWEPKRFNIMVRPFNERYPYIKITYIRGSYEARALRPLVAYESGRSIADLATGLGSAVARYVSANAFDDARVLPAAAAVPDNAKGADGSWLGMRLRYWCISYNVDRVKKEDLPARWDDLVANPRWATGTLGLTNIPDTWLLPLWATNGIEWGERFTDALFLKLKPQIRKEGANALITLVSIGELDASIPASDHEMREYQKKGAPVAWHCPQPIPTAVSEMVLLRNAPNIDAARLFANWLLSREGQIAQFEQDHSPPVHKDLQLPQFMLFPDEIMGKTTTFRDMEVKAMAERFHAHWVPLWERRRQ